VNRVQILRFSRLITKIWVKVNLGEPEEATRRMIKIKKEI